MDSLTELLTAVASWCAPAMLVAAAVILALESGLLLGFVLPGSGTVVAVGALVGLGELRPVAAAVLLTAASTAGAQLAFVTIRRGRCAVESTRSGRVSRLVDRVVQRAGRLFDGDASVGAVTTHFIGGTRTLGPRLAAMSSLSYRKFAVLNTCAAAAWVIVLLAAGSVASARPAVVPWVSAALVVSVVTVVGVRCVRRSRTALT